MESSQLVHFYSYVTGVSLELPVGFEFDGEDESTVSYAELGDPGPAADAPRVWVSVLARFEAEVHPDDALVRLGELADGFAAVGELVDRQSVIVDESPGVTVVVRRDGAVVQQSAFVADSKIITVLAVAPAGRSDLVAAYAAAVASIRFIAL